MSLKHLKMSGCKSFWKQRALFFDGSTALGVCTFKLNYVSMHFCCPHEQNVFLSEQDLAIRLQPE